MTKPDRPTRYDLLAIGEGQLRLGTALGVPIDNANELSVHVAGTEGNVAGLLARLGNRTALISALPDSGLGRRVLSEYREAGIDTSLIAVQPGGRVALYFVEQSSPPVPSRVTYDRRDSCFAKLRSTDIDWSVVPTARLVHNSGISAALTDHTYEIVENSMRLARESGVRTSFDVNYRSRLWDPATAANRLRPLLRVADILFCSRRDAELLFGIAMSARDTAARLSDEFAVATVVVSDGAGSVEVVTDGTRLSERPPATSVVDRVGAGDALIGGFLHGVLSADVTLALELGVAAAALALTRLGDQLRTTLSELTELSRTLGQEPDIVR